MRERVKSILENVMVIVWFLFITVLILYVVYDFGRQRSKVMIEHPMKVYSDYTIQPLDELGLLGIIDKKDFENFLKIKDEIPFRKEGKMGKDKIIKEIERRIKEYDDALTEFYVLKCKVPSTFSNDIDTLLICCFYIKQALENLLNQIKNQISIHSHN